MTRWKLFCTVALLSTRDRDAGIRTGCDSGVGRLRVLHPDGDVLQANRPWSRAPAGVMAAVPSGANDTYAYMGESADVSSCSQRYRSFDPASGTFVGYGGHRHPCQ